jgi:hypothetical protein
MSSLEKNPGLFLSNSRISWAKVPELLIARLAVRKGEG